MEENKDFSRHLERELKLNLTAEEWKKLFVLGDGNLQKQTNYYYESENIYCRIRECSKEWTLTCKLKISEAVLNCGKDKSKSTEFSGEKDIQDSFLPRKSKGTASNDRNISDNIFLCEEFNCALTALAADKFLQDGKIPAQTINHLTGQCVEKDFVLMGSLTTYRSKIDICGNVVELDTNVYKGKVDFELECELEQGFLPLNLQKFLEKQKILPRKSDGKFFRFKAASQNLEEEEQSCKLKEFFDLLCIDSSSLNIEAELVRVG